MFCVLLLRYSASQHLLHDVMERPFRVTTGIVLTFYLLYSSLNITKYLICHTIWLKHITMCHLHSTGVYVSSYVLAGYIDNEQVLWLGYWYNWSHITHLSVSDLACMMSHTLSQTHTYTPLCITSYQTVLFSRTQLGGCFNWCFDGSFASLVS